ncbi:hypothetical protein AM493_09420 [Flavobacterium akiainvivens]|uniref:YdhG-like domain-containing protein n=1 Tax=Flavobacterium akiainvivens TaxID=1202724 RepID=A0A0M9VJY7_9FLAO|nr:DUF1801 domain-containing protein [Flavobacterium akiainvivens]KOS08290.1 hypothetical protein AM493_09420 [Flavobacterium akiainvivens]SFQ68707.1 Uncharacterized conserved protein YdhG, YjbR/CyaY-like superfamily, DUF1801 family [Flavobacterium akiainvivens]
MLSVDEYINNQPPAYQDSLNRMRAFIQSKIPPQSEEKISYMVPCYYYHYSLVGFGVSKNHISFYTMSPKLVAELKDELKDIKHFGSTIHFPLDKPFPETLLKKIINIRIKENEARALAKKKKQL